MKAPPPPTEFDRFAADYLDTHRANVAISGEEPEYFARYKIDIVRGLYTRRGLPYPRSILDFGTGIGNSVPHLKAAFPDASVSAVDVSAESLEIGRRRFGEAAAFIRYDGKRLPLADHAVDLAFSACVFHHIDPARRAGSMAELRRVLAPGGRLVIFEHNPINPVTQYIVATCAFDRDARLLSAGELVGLQRRAGFPSVTRAYTGFFPSALSGLRRFEPFLGKLPLGAQYYTEAHG